MGADFLAGGVRHATGVVAAGDVRHATGVVAAYGVRAFIRSGVQDCQ